MINSRKNLTVFVGIVLLVAMLLLSAGPVLAQRAPVVPAGGAGAPAPQSLSQKGFGGALTDIAKNALIIYAVIFFLQSLASGIMTLAGVIMDRLFILNIALAPNNISVVMDGWVIMRDIANSLFILIVLWIAFTIIFNFESLGGRKLLVRVILVALLINFSLVMVSSVFGFANVLARPFQVAITGENGSASLSDVIMTKTKVYNAVALVQDGDIAKIKEEQQKTSIFEKTGNIIAEGTTAKSVLIGCGLGSAVLAATGIGIPAAAGLATNCALLAPVISSWASSFLTEGSPLGVLAPVKSAVSMALGVIFLLLTAFAFLTAAIVLLWRIVAMVLIAILAPGAFLLHALPGNYGKKYWEMWLESLFKWAFFAPAFYFLVYIALLILSRMSEGQDQFNIFTGDLNRIFTLIVFLAFLFAAIGVARKMGITVADSFIKLGQKAGWAALGFAGGAVWKGAKSVATRGITRAVKPEGAVSRGLTQLAESPRLRWLGGAYPQRLATKFIGTRQQQIDKQEKDVAAFSKQQLMADYAASFSPERKVAILRRMAKEGWMKDFEDRYHEDGIKSGLELATRYGGQGPILEELPHLATTQNVLNLPANASNQDAVNAVVKRIKDKANISSSSYENPMVKRAILKNIKGPGELEHIARDNFKMYRTLDNFYESTDGQNALNETFAQMDASEAGSGTALKENLQRYKEFVLGRVFREKTVTAMKEDIRSFNSELEDMERRLARMGSLTPRDEREENRTKLRIEELRDRVYRLSEEVAERESRQEQPSNVHPPPPTP